MKSETLLNVSNFRTYEPAELQSGMLKGGRLYRGGDLSQLTQTEQKILFEDLGIRMILDLRMSSEIEKAVDHYPEDVAYCHINVLGEQDGISGNPAEILKELHERDSFSVMSDLYDHLVLHPLCQQHYCGFFRAVLKYGDVPIYFHCTAGKDRTGIAAAFLMKVLGMDQEQILEDYLLSNHYRKELMEAEIARLQKMYPERSHEVISKRIGDIIGVRKEYLLHAFQKINEIYYTFANYAREVLGLHPEDILALRNMFLD